MFFRIILAAAAAIFLLSDPSYGTEITIGLIPEQNVFKQMARYKPIGEYIEKKTGIKIKFTILSRYGNIIDRLKAEKIDGAFFGSFTGALAIRKLGVEFLARPVNLDGTSTYRGYIFVRKDRGIRNVSDMKGRKLAFVDRATTAGYVFPMAYFREKGIKDIKTYFREYYFAGSHDAAIYAVLDGKFDVGCAKHSMYDRVARDDRRVKNDLLILAESPPVPSNGLGVRKDLNVEVKKRLKDILLSLHDNPEGKEILRRFEATKFIATTEEDYGPVFDLADKAGINLKTYKYVNQ